MPGETTFKEQKQAETNPLLRMQSDYSSSNTFSMLFEAALNRAFDKLTNWKRGDDLRPLLARLAEHCYKAGIPEEEVVRQTLMHYYRDVDELVVRVAIHNFYRECKGFGTRSSMTAEQDTAFRLEEFMKRRYEFRYNTVLGRTGIPPARFHTFSLPSSRPANTKQYRPERPERGYPSMGPGRGTLPYLDYIHFTTCGRIP